MVGLYGKGKNKHGFIFKTSIYLRSDRGGRLLRHIKISLAGSRRVRLTQMAENGDKRAQEVINLQEKPGPFFSVIQIGINAVAILGGIVGEAAFTDVFAGLFKWFVPAQYLAETHRSDESGENFRMPDRFNAGAHQSFETVRLASDGYFQCAHEALWSSDSKQKQNYQ